MSSHLTTTNLSLFSIPIYWTLALWPQAYSAFIIKSANNSNWNNANPRGSETIESYKKTVPAEVYGRFERAKAAHNNLMENAPLFIGSVVVGHIAQLSPSTLNYAAGAHLLLRVLYVVLYINTTKQRYSYYRSGVWTLCVALSFGVLVRAGNKIAFGGA